MANKNPDRFNITSHLIDLQEILLLRKAAKPRALFISAVADTVRKY
jgi:hypothetical protein